MKLKIYAVYDRVASEFPFTFKAKNDDMMKRVCMSALLDKQSNIMNSDTDDKDVYYCGEYETETAVITPIRPEFVLHLSEVRAELLAKIRASKIAAGVNPDEEEKINEE